MKKKITKLIINLLLIISIITLIFSLYKIIIYKKEENNIKEELNIINNNVKIEENNDNENTLIIEQNDINDNNPYYDYIKMNLIDVDFNNLKFINNDVKGWIQVNGTNINYPFVQSNDNKYYLNHSFDKSYNNGGWVFLDYRNNISNFDNKNTILYAHGRIDKVMFGTLKDTLTSNWLSNTDNHVIKISTEYENSLWQVFSIYHIETTSDYIKTNFNDNEFETFINMLLNRSMYNFNTNVSSSDRILTLSTCYSNTEKMVLHAKLIKRETK